MILTKPLGLGVLTTAIKRGLASSASIARAVEVMTTLNRVASDFKRLQVQIAALNPENPTARTLVEQARTEIHAGRLRRARELLREATQAQIAAGQQADVAAAVHLLSLAVLRSPVTDRRESLRNSCRDKDNPKIIQISSSPPELPSNTSPYLPSGYIPSDELSSDPVPSSDATAAAAAS